MMVHTEQMTDPRGLEMIALLRRQATLYERLEALARDQHGMLADEDTRPLLGILAQRQRLTGELQDLGRRMKPLRDDWAQLRSGLPPAERAEAEKLIADARSRLSRLLAADEEDARHLRVRKQRVAESLKGIGANRRAISAYRTQASESNQIDRMHEES